MQKVWIIWSPLLYLNFKSFVHQSSSSFIRFQCILHHSGGIFSESWNFYKLKKGDPISGGNQLWRKSEIFDPPFCIWILKVFYIKNSSSLIRFQCMLHEWKVLFSETWNFYKLKKADLISGRNQFCRKFELFGPPFCISILKCLQSQILHHLLDFNEFCMIQEYFSQSLEISTN